MTQLYTGMQKYQENKKLYPNNRVKQKEQKL